MKSIFLVSAGFLLFISCNKKQGPQGPAGETGARGDQGAPAVAGTGTISGNIMQYLYSGASYTQNLNTVSVSVNGTTLATVTDANGNYTLTGVPSGVRELLVRKKDNGLLRLRQLVLTDNAHIIANGPVMDKPPYAFTGGYLKDTLNGTSLVGRMYFNSPQQGKYFALLMGSTPDIDPEDPATYDYSFTDFRSGNVFSFFLSLQSIPSTMHFFYPGKKMYANLYPCSAYSGLYDVPEKYCYAIPTCGAPIGPTISFIIPNQ